MRCNKLESARCLCWMPPLQDVDVASPPFPTLFARTGCETTTTFLLILLGLALRSTSLNHNMHSSPLLDTLNGFLTSFPVTEWA